ncbi:hypothetical protein SAMN03159341_107160 [Paenibacillus sp. 1_12]|uniref:hypothetical protein n=1 Tax=Paenibacillus sp. 1_12 TaxID=1566278 RepID=UPI0008F13E17|nr:hypothetical protein [Paenibacillus sp. 1_12]SFL56599.1 hypothetical protein SAMN03159341_107160 [Paenibacillus sp. 1_12]
MRTILTLARFELSRYSAYMPGTSKSSYRRIGLIFFLLLVVSMAWSRGETTVSSLYAFGLVVFLETMLIIMVWEALSVGRNGRDQKWWLLLPYSRLTLVLGKGLSYLWLGLYLIMFMLLLCTTHYALLLVWGSIQQADAMIIGYAAGTAGWLALVFLPVLTSLGLLMFVFQMWWARIGTMIVFLYISMQLLIVTFLVVSSIWISLQFTLPSTQTVIVLILAGWLLSCAGVWLSSTVGMKKLAQLRFTGYAALSSPDSVLSQNVVPTQRAGRRASPFWAMVAMEKRRYQWIGRHAPRRIRWLVFTLMALLTFLGYHNSGSLTDVILFQSTLTMIGYMGIVVYGFNRNADYGKGFALWWLAFPHSRYLLLGSRIFAYLVSMVSYWLLAVLSAVVGVLLRQGINPMSGGDLGIAGLYFIENAVLMIPLAVFYVLAVQITPAVNKYPVLILFLLPLLISYGLSIQLPNLWIMPDRLPWLTLRNGPAPDFLPHLMLLYGIGILVSLIGFGLGGKYLNRYSMMKNSIWVRSLRNKEQ